MLKAGREALLPLPSLTLITMLDVVPTLLDEGVPESLPLLEAERGPGR